MCRASDWQGGWGGGAHRARLSQRGLPPGLCKAKVEFRVMKCWFSKVTSE